MEDLSIADCLPGLVYRPNKELVVRGDGFILTGWHESYTEDLYSITFGVFPKEPNNPSVGSSVAVQVMACRLGHETDLNYAQAHAFAERTTDMLTWDLTPTLQDAFDLPRTRKRHYAPIPIATARQFNVQAGWQYSTSFPDDILFPRYSGTLAIPPTRASIPAILTDLAGRLPPLFGDPSVLVDTNTGDFYRLTLVDHEVDCLVRLPSDEQLVARPWSNHTTAPPMPENLTAVEERALQHLRELATEYAKLPYLSSKQA